MQSVVTGQAPITLERKITSGGKQLKTKDNTHNSCNKSYTSDKNKKGEIRVRIKIHIYHMLNELQQKPKPRRQHGKSVIARDRERQPSTNQITALTRATPVIYQSYLPDGRSQNAYIARRTRRQHTSKYKNAHHTASHATMDVQSRHRTSPWSTRFVLGKTSEHRQRSRSYHADPLSRRREFATASYALRPNLNKCLLFAVGDGSRISVICLL